MFQKDKLSVKVCGAGCLKMLADILEYAMPLTCPTLKCVMWKFRIAPAPTKVEAVMRTLNREIGEKYPATILLRRANVSSNLIRTAQRESGA